MTGGDRAKKKTYNRIDEILKWKFDNKPRKDLAKEIKMDATQLSKIANGQDCLLSTARKIAHGLNETIDYIWPN